MPHTLVDAVADLEQTLASVNQLLFVRHPLIRVVKTFQGSLDGPHHLLTLK